MVVPLFERYPDSVPGPFYVILGQCIICGLPPEIAPASITWSPETFRSHNCRDCPTHCRIERQPETGEEIESLIEAACGSCVGAIRYCGTAPDILARFKALGYERLCDALVDRGPNQAPATSAGSASGHGPL
jgi:hypothetical protein